jgi:threonine/homoserine/homoserine lactone efflux protein
MAFAIRDGILLGITLATLFGFGPALLALVQTSIHRGFKAGISLALGVFLSDLFLVLLSFEGMIQIVVEPKNKIAFGLVGGIILIVFGIITTLRKARTDVDEIEVKNPRTITYILKGFFLNVANPFIWIFWMGTMIAITSNYEQNEVAILTMFATTLITVFISDVLKSYAAGKLKSLLTYGLLTWINRIAGIGLIIFGIVLIVRAFLH